MILIRLQSAGMLYIECYEHDLFNLNVYLNFCTLFNIITINHSSNCSTLLCMCTCVCMINCCSYLLLSCCACCLLCNNTTVVLLFRHSMMNNRCDYFLTRSRPFYVTVSGSFFLITFTTCSSPRQILSVNRL